MAFADLASSIENFAASIGNLLNNKAGDVPYPTVIGGKPSVLINTHDPANWNKIIFQPYVFRVVDSATLGDVNDPIFQDFDDFPLQINPQDMMQDEIFSINITPTQDGVISEHNGIVLRDLVISGTTGIHPLKGAGGATKKGKLIGASPSAVSGYDEFNQLRNYFRAYAEAKRENKNYKISPVLVFSNQKDLEDLIVEPLKFSMKRQGEKGFLYDYQITLKIIGNLAFSKDDANPNFFQKIDNVISDINDYMAIGTGLLLAGSSILGQIEREVTNTLFEPLRQIDLAVNTIAGIGNQIWHMGNDFIGLFNSSQTVQFFQSIGNSGADVKLPANQAVAANAGGKALLNLGPAALNKIPLDTSLLSTDQLAQFQQSALNATNLPRTFYKTFQQTLTRIGNNLADSLALGSTLYDTFEDRTVTFVPSPTKQASLTEIGILYGFAQLQKAMNLILSFEGNITPPNVTTRINSIESNFNNNITIPIPPSVIEIKIPTGATLEGLAFQYLNDWSRWIELVELNNLVPPFIDPTGTINNTRVKLYGQTLLLPSNLPQVNTNIRIADQTIYTQNLSETEIRMGIDLLVDPVNFDFVFANTGDFQLAVAETNLRQAIVLKIMYEKGDLKYHPQIGLGFVVGDKITTALQDAYVSINRTILSDPRIDKINSFKLSVNGSTIILDLHLNVAESATPVPLNIAL